MSERAQTVSHLTLYQTKVSEKGKTGGASDERVSTAVLRSQPTKEDAFCPSSYSSGERSVPRRARNIS